MTIEAIVTNAINRSEEIGEPVTINLPLEDVIFFLECAGYDADWMPTDTGHDVWGTEEYLLGEDPVISWRLELEAA